MKLLQLNAWMGRLTPQILKLITDEKPDILTTQEMFDTDGPVVFPDNMFNCLDQVKQAGSFEYVYFSPTWSTQIAHQKADFGNAIFSKYPITSQRTIFTNGNYVSDLTPETQVKNTRNAQFVTLDVNGQTLHLINHHGHWEITPEGSDTSVQKIQTILSEIEQLSGPIIMAGDLNINPGTPAMKLFEGKLEDLTATYQLPTTLSILGKVQNVSCDHILVNSEVQVHTFFALDELVSDHKALGVEFEIKSS